MLVKGKGEDLLWAQHHVPRWQRNCATTRPMSTLVHFVRIDRKCVAGFALPVQEWGYRLGWRSWSKNGD
eukprot:12918648-Prorocentrum_lima.AAC.1